MNSHLSRASRLSHLSLPLPLRFTKTSQPSPPSMAAPPPISCLFHRRRSPNGGLAPYVPVQDLPLRRAMPGLDAFTTCSVAPVLRCFSCARRAQWILMRACSRSIVVFTVIRNRRCSEACETFIIPKVEVGGGGDWGVRRDLLSVSLCRTSKLAKCVSMRFQKNMPCSELCCPGRV